MSHPSIQRLMNQTVTTTSNRPSLHEGQIFHGQVKQLYKGEMAEVQIGNQKLMARLEVPLKAGDSYFFQVKSIEPELQLKIITGPLNATDTKAKQLMNLMESMQLPKHTEMQTLLNVFLDWKLPISRENLIVAAQMLKSAPPNSQEEALRSIQRIIELKLPLSDLNFKTFFGIETKEGIHGVLDLLRTSLVYDLDLPAQQKEGILKTLDQLRHNSNSIVEQSINGNVMKEVIQKLVNTMGLNYEAELIQKEPNLKKIRDMLKPQLVALLNDPVISPALREAGELTLARMNGSLLHSGETGMNQQIIMQLPLEFLGKRIDAQLQWNGRMKDDGKIDPEYARVMFYLDLESIKKTVIDMQVQNKVVTVTIFNDDERLKVIGSFFQDTLKSGLESVDYKLSGVSFKKLTKEKSLKKIQSTTDFKGVDLRI
ncbi:hypothetical protein NSQ43_09640 [Sporosarcina sp. FSL W8-0480]|uniref:hypothetical protein n=1 Tax=Sporosarcina sp. FSL W8-0480 TaxID=2954701 RepID=UPI0030D8A05F